MIGIIFAAGIGSRLRPFTDSHPKALAPLGGEPILIRVARKLLDAGARRLIVNVHHFPDQVVAELKRQPFAGLVEISDESDMLLDTGGALARIGLCSEVLASADESEPVVVHNADIFTDFPLDGMISAHISGNADATILTDPRRQSSRHFLFAPDGRLCGWENTDKNIIRPDGLDKSGLSAAAFGGIHVLSPATIRQIACKGIHPFSIVDWYLDSCASARIMSYTPAAPYRWHDIGTPAKLAAAQEAFSTKS